MKEKQCKNTGCGKKTSIGGQALIEGIMMRGPAMTAMAVRNPEGEIVLDTTGKRSGRGAYICKNADCLKKARRSRRIEQSLEASISPEIYEKLEVEIDRA